MEKTRGQRDVELTTRRGGVKWGNGKPAINHFPMCSPQSEPLRDVHGVTQRREEGGRRQVARRINGGIKRRETDPASNRFPKYSPQPKIQRDPLSWVEKKKGRGEIEETWWRKRRVKRGREQSGQ